MQGGLWDVCVAVCLVSNFVLSNSPFKNIILILYCYFSPSFAMKNG